MKTKVLILNELVKSDPALAAEIHEAGYALWDNDYKTGVVNEKPWDQKELVIRMHRQNHTNPYDGTVVTFVDDKAVDQKGKTIKIALSDGTKKRMGGEPTVYTVTSASVQINADGTIARDTKGKPIVTEMLQIEAYSNGVYMPTYGYPAGFSNFSYDLETATRTALTDTTNKFYVTADNDTAPITYGELKWRDILREPLGAAIELSAAFPTPLGYTKVLQALGDGNGVHIKPPENLEELLNPTPLHLYFKGENGKALTSEDYKSVKKHLDYFADVCDAELMDDLAKRREAGRISEKRETQISEALQLRNHLRIQELALIDAQEAQASTKYKSHPKSIFSS